MLYFPMSPNSSLAAIGPILDNIPGIASASNRRSSVFLFRWTIAHIAINVFSGFLRPLLLLDV